MIAGMVSTIIPVYNRKILLIEAVNSVFSQTHKNVEIIIINDGSNDQTTKLLDKLEKENAGAVKVIHSINEGPGPAREKGRLAARGEYIQYLDSDDILLPDKLEQQIKQLENNPDAGICYGRTSLQHVTGKVISNSWKETGKANDYLFPRLLVDRWWCTHTPLYRRSVTDKIGPWCGLPCHEDWEYDARAAGQNVKLTYIDQHVSIHRSHDGDRASQNKLDLDQKHWFLNKLLEYAEESYVDKGIDEYKHFQKWIFTTLRDSDIKGDYRLSNKLLLLANKSKNRHIKFMAYKILKKILGNRTLTFALRLNYRFLTEN